MRRRGLAYGQAGRLRTLPPARHHLADAHPPEETDWRRTITHYCQLSEELGRLAGRPGGGEALARLSREAANVTVAVKQTLEEEQPDQGYTAAGAFIEAARFSGIDAATVAQALHAATERSGDTKTIADANRRLADFALARSDHDAAREAFEQALPLHRQVGSVLGEANCIQSLGDIALERSDHDAARKAFEQALSLYARIREPYSIGLANRRLARLTNDPVVRCGHVSEARDAWLRIKRHDLVAALADEFDDCD